MNTRSRAAVRLAFALAGVLALPVVSFAQVKVLLSGGFAAAFREILPDFERAAGVTVTATPGASQGSDPNTIGAQLRRGVPADLVIMNRVGLNDLIAEGRIVAGTDRDLASTALGVAVRAGAPKPDITTVEAFTQTLLHATSVTFDPSTTGIYLRTTLFPRLGIADAMAAKSTTAGVAAVASGEAEIAVQPVSEILAVRGVELVGLVPPEVQFTARFAAAVVNGATNLEGAARLIAFLTSDSSVAAIRKSGMEPSRSALARTEPLAPYLVGLSVANAGASAKWYEDTLGFVVERRMDLPEQRLTIVFLKSGTFRLELVEKAGAQPLTKAAPELTDAMMVLGLKKLAFAVADVDATAARLRTRGVRVVVEPFTDASMKVRSFIVADPDGNLLQFMQEAK